jgi:hypothetical protein
MKREVLAILSEAGGGCHFGQAKCDPESSPTRSGIQRILDSGFCRNDGVSEFCKSLKKKLFGAEPTESPEIKIRKLNIYNQSAKRGDSSNLRFAFRFI